MPVVGGAIAGDTAKAAAISGGMNVAQEMGPESIESAAKRTAEEIAKEFSEAFKNFGWNLVLRAVSPLGEPAWLAIARRS